MTLLLLALAVDYANTALIGALGPTLERVFHFNNGQLVLLAAASGIVGTIATIPIGILTDRVKRTRVLAISLMPWAVAMVATGAAISFVMLFGARLLLGAVAATTGPAVPSLTGDLVPADKRARALGFISSGQLIGTGLGFVLAAVVTAFLSFRWCFWLLAIAGAVLALAFWRAREPARTGAAGGPDAAQQGGRVQELVRAKGIEPSGRALLKEDPARMSMWDAARYVLRVRTDVIVLISRIVGDFFFAAIGTFAVIFAIKQYGLSQREADLVILVLGVGALSGVLLVGRAADALLRRGRLNSRLWLGAGAYIIAPFPLLPAFLTHSLWVALPLITVGAFFVAGAGPPLDAVRVDVLVPRLRGRAEAIRQVLRTAAEGGAPLIVGILSGRLAGGGTAGLQLALIITLPTLLASGLILLIALRVYQRDVAAALASTERVTSD